MAFKLFAEYVSDGMKATTPYVPVSKPSNIELELVRKVISKTESSYEGSIDVYDVFGSTAFINASPYSIWIMYQPDGWNYIIHRILKHL